MASLDDDNDLKRLLAQRRELDRELYDRHSVEMAVLFTDIVGSTQLYEQKGDIEGLARVHKHNDILFPVVDAHGGRIVKTIGDAIMAVFPDPARGVDCAAEMQRRLAEAQAGDEDPIRIRAGVHAGRVLVDGDDVFGDTVNTAARVAGAAGAGEVLLSASLFEALPEGTPHRARPKGELSFKGKAEPVAVVELEWRGAAGGRAVADAGAEQLFVLEVGLADDGVRVAALDGAKDKTTVKAYAVEPLARAELDERARHIATLAHGGGERAYLDDVKAAGGWLFAHALSERARTRLRETELTFLRLHLDDALVQVPWELCHDGASYVGLRFAMGRVVAARADAPPPKRTKAGGGCLVLSNPTGDLPASSREGQAVAALLRDAALDDVVHLDGPRRKAEVLGALAGRRLVHFAGHTGVESSAGGLMLSDGVLLAAEMAALGDPPELVFVNGCRASTSAGWIEGQSGLATTLLMHGVEHYLAPAWEIPDDDALFFALRFYEAALWGAPYGLAVKSARLALAEGGARPLSFAGYALYGEPRASLRLPASRPARAPLRSTSKDRMPAVAALPMPPRQPDASVHAKRAATMVFGAMGVGVVIALALTITMLVAREHKRDELKASTATPATTPPPAPTPAPAPARREGPVRISVLPFKNTTGDAALDYLKDGLAEVVVTDLGADASGVKLVERGQIDIDIAEIEFSQSRYVDPVTRAALGKIAGAEVVVVGAYQKGDGKLRATARFVDVESGEVLATAKVDRPADEVFALQDDLARKVTEATAAVKGRMRP